MNGPERTLVQHAANGSSEPNLPRCCNAAKVGYHSLDDVFRSNSFGAGKTAPTFDQQNGHFPETAEFSFPGLWPI
jgi:hypothetical protein